MDDLGIHYLVSALQKKKINSNKQIDFDVGFAESVPKFGDDTSLYSKF